MFRYKSQLVLTCLLAFGALTGTVLADDEIIVDKIELRGAYAYGAYLAGMLERNEEFSSRAVDVEYFVLGMEDRLNKDLKFSEDELSVFYDDYSLYLRDGERAYLEREARREAERVARENAVISAQYMESNGGNDGIMTTSSGLQYMVLHLSQERTAPTPGLMNSVTVHYEGALTDGTVFDSSIERDQPGTFQLTRVIIVHLIITQPLQLLLTIELLIQGFQGAVHGATASHLAQTAGKGLQWICLQTMKGKASKWTAGLITQYLVTAETLITLQPGNKFIIRIRCQLMFSRIQKSGSRKAFFNPNICLRLFKRSNKTARAKLLITIITVVTCTQFRFHGI